MKNGLNIPLQTETRRSHWRVVWILAFFSIFLITLFGCRLFFLRDTTSSFRPTEADSTMHIVKNARTISWIHENIGSVPLFENSPWTYDDALSFSKQGFSIHYKEGEPIAATFDRPLPDKDKKLATEWGFTAISQKRRSLLSHDTKTTTGPAFSIRPSYFLPWNHGKLLWHEDAGRDFTIRFKKKRLIIRDLGNKQPENALFFPKNAESLAIFHIEQGEIPALLAQQLPYTVSSTLQQFLHGNTTIGLAKDHLGLIYIINAQTTDVTTEELSRLSKEILSRYALTTTALTLDDSTQVTELRTDTEHIAIDVQTQEDATFLTAKHKSGAMIRLTKTPDRLLLTNRENSAEVSDFFENSVCNIRTTSYIHVKQMQEMTDPSTAYQPIFEQPLYSFFPFSHIAFTRGKMVGCW